MPTQKTVRGHRCDGRGRTSDREGVSAVGGVGVWLLQLAEAAAVSPFDPLGMADRRHQRGPHRFSQDLWLQARACRPRKTLGWKTPAEALNEHLSSLQQPGVATTG